MLNDLVIASLEPAAGYRFRKPARMTVTLQPVVFKNTETLNQWYRQRKMKIEQGFEAQKVYFKSRDSTCLLDATCNLLDEELNEK